ncbi:MAG: DUF29 family protein [Proteobacteria bacterium]|nr:DUF29 family protein [Pseudomonadota bacterium]
MSFQFALKKECRDENKASPRIHTNFYAWILHNAALLREGKLSEIDSECVIEEFSPES